MSQIPVSLGIAVVAHPAREAMVKRLLPRLDGAEASVVWDRTNAGCWPTVRRAWELAEKYSGLTHWLLLCDDSLVCAEFVASARLVLAAQTKEPVNFYANRQVIAEADSRNQHLGGYPRRHVGPGAVFAGGDG